MKNPSILAIKKFQKEIKTYYKHNRRTFAWRETRDPYKILVSEVMLQQTQASRVIVKYKSFLKKFPTIKHLSQASLTDLLKEWQGLGYNRRALYLKKTAVELIDKHAGKFPQDRADLMALPGIGQSTAGAIAAFAWNKPALFIETNIRTVYIYFFFKKDLTVHDTTILSLLDQTIDKKNPRDWYYALYDYGSMLKTKNKNLRSIHQKSAHYTKQSTFKGSNREIRSHIIKALLQSAPLGLSLKQITSKTSSNVQVISKNLSTMQKEGLIVSNKNLWKLA